jgi:sugar fermentation stimulation protein A
MTLHKKFINGILVKRYKRFFADVQLDNKLVTAHCPNTGSMLGLLDAGNKVYLSESDNEKRKLKYTLEVIKLKSKHVGVNTHRTNRIVEKALNEKVFTFIKNIKEIRREVKYGENSKIDFLVSTSKEQVYIEVKNVTLARNKSVAEFPDAVTARGTKHLIELSKLKKKGIRAIMLYIIQRDDCESFQLAKDIDPTYAENIDKAMKRGVEVFCYDCKFSNKDILINREIKFIND